MNRLLILVVITLMIPGHSLGKVEGTAQLGVTQGLDSRAVLRINIEDAGELIRVCSSDDGKQEANTADGAVDNQPGADN